MDPPLWVVIPPRIALWIRPGKVGPRLGEMAATAQGLKPLGGPPSTTELHRDDVIDL